MAGASHSYTGAVSALHRFAGAEIARIMHPPGQRIDAHGHDWPVLTLFCIGAYRERGEAGEIGFDGPSLAYHPSGAAHEDQIGASGLETLAISFDPAWLGAETRAHLPDRTCWRQGGTLGARARALAAVWLRGEEQQVRVETERLLRVAARARVAPPRPAWFDAVDAALERARPTAEIAAALKRNPAWLARAYRAWRGEGLGETVRRRRVEAATLALRSGRAPLAEIAAECGFADQSHMNRAFGVVLGRTPLAVRREAGLLAGLG